MVQKLAVQVRQANRGGLAFVPAVSIQIFRSCQASWHGARSNGRKLTQYSPLIWRFENPAGQIGGESADENRLETNVVRKMTQIPTKTQGVVIRVG